MKILHVLLLWFAFLAVLDVATTMHILDRGGVELNPLAHPFLAFGVLGLLVQKAGALVVVGVLMFFGIRFADSRNVRHVGGAYAVALSPVAAFPVAWNLGVIV